jgi:hypothetical protein
MSPQLKRVESDAALPKEVDVAVIAFVLGSTVA